MERTGGVTAVTDHVSPSCVVGNGCLLAEPTKQGDDPSGEIGMNDAYGDIASTILILVFFVAAFVWAKRSQSKGRFGVSHQRHPLEDWLREEEEWHDFEDAHRRFWSNH